jgi:hypothetical protein
MFQLNIADDGLKWCWRHFGQSDITSYHCIVVFRDGINVHFEVPDGVHGAHWYATEWRSDWVPLLQSDVEELQQ